MIALLRRKHTLAALAAALGAMGMLSACAQTGPAPATSPGAPAVAPGAAPSAAPPPEGPPPAPRADTDKTPAQPSAMTSQMFFDVLVGELTARTGDPQSGVELTLEAARAGRDPRLFVRAVEIALQSRQPEAALDAARAWKQALPNSRDARGMELQLLVRMNRIAESAEPLRAEIAATPIVERPMLMAVIARTYARANDKKAAAAVVEKALADELQNPATAGLAWTVVGRLRLLAGDTSGALEAAQAGQNAQPTADGPAVLALDLMGPAQPLAEPIVKRYLGGPNPMPEVRMAFARALVEDRRYAEATAELQALTSARPDLPAPWLLLGSLQAQARQDAPAETSLKRYVELASNQSDADERTRGLAQAYLQLSQIAERRKDYAAAESWLRKVEGMGELAAAQARRAALLARQGKLAQARALIRDLPERSPEDKRQKFQTEVQLLRDAKEYQAAYDLLTRESSAQPEDADLLYDRAMMAEKLNRLDEMERLLRRLIELKPDNQNAYNALGYSLADRNVRLAEARTLILKAVELAPEDPFIADSLGWVEFRMGNTAEALRILEAAYKKRPDPEIGAHLGEVLWASGQRDRALVVWKEASLSDGDNETLQETLKRLRIKL